MVASSLLDPLIATAIEAGRVAHDLYVRGCAVVSKADASPVTEADHAAEAVILHALATLAPTIPVVAEEEAAAGRVPTVADRFFLVDPLDGTKEFVRRTGDFTVNIALVEHGEPTLGIVYAPARGLLYAGLVGTGAWRADQSPDASPSARRAIAAVAPATPLRIVGSASHGSAACDAYLDAWPAGERLRIGSSLKFCLLAEGSADLYARSTPTMEWDTAAGHAVLLAAGGRLEGVGGASFRYGKPGFLNGGFVASGRWQAPPLAPTATIAG